MNRKNLLLNNFINLSRHCDKRLHHREHQPGSIGTINRTGSTGINRGDQPGQRDQPADQPGHGSTGTDTDDQPAGINRDRHGSTGINRDRSTGTDQPGQINRDRSTGTDQPGQINRDRSTGTDTDQDQPEINRDRHLIILNY